MWYYTVHGNNSQLLESSKSKYATEYEAMEAGRAFILCLPRLGLILSLQAGMAREPNEQRARGSLSPHAFMEPGFCEHVFPRARIRVVFLGVPYPYSCPPECLAWAQT